MEYEIIKLKKDDFEILIPLMQNCFGMDVNIDYFKWKYIDNPAGLVEGYYAKHITTGEVAAYYGVIPQNYIIQNEKQKWFQSCDTMTHTNHRRKGLFQKLANHCYSELTKSNNLVIIGFGGSESTPGFIKFGWKQIFNTKNYFRPAFLSKLQVFLNSDQVQEVSVEDIINSLIISEKYYNNMINLFLDKDVIKWRLNNPLKKYKILGLRNKNNTLDAYIIYFLEKNKCIILDFYYNNSKSLNCILKKISESESFSIYLYFGQEKCSKTKKLVSNSFFSNPFNKGPLSQKTPFIIYSRNRNDQEIIENKKNWNVTPVYHDSL
jgi:hypothetical protein